jgi:hypothetical protein
MNDQLALIEVSDEEALLLPTEQLRKRYTAGQAQKIDWKRDCIKALLACGLPIETVALKAHVNERIVKEILAIYAASIAADMGAFGDYAMSRAAKFLALADQKAHAAPFKEQIAAASFIGKMGMDMKLASTGMDSAEQPAIDVENENEQLQRAREWLQKMQNEKLKVQNGDAAGKPEDANCAN